jgi:hypothetical protein
VNLCFQSAERGERSAAETIDIAGSRTSGRCSSAGPGPLHFTPQNDQLMSVNHILSLKSALRLEWRGQDGQDEAEQSEHDPLTLGDSFG